MSWLTIKEYCAATGRSDSTVRRHIRRKSVLHRLEKGQYLLYLEGGEKTAMAVPAITSSAAAGALSMAPQAQVDLARIEEIVSFSSKALNSYLTMSDRLAQEKDTRLREKEEQIRELKQRLLDLERRLGLYPAAGERGERLVP